MIRNNYLAVLSAMGAGLLFSCVPVEGAVELTWGTAADFSVEQGNPNGAWSYGHMSLSFESFTLHTTGDYSGGGSGPVWYTSATDSPPYGSVWKNTTNVVIEGVKPNQVSIHPCASTAPGVIRWTAPAGVLGSTTVSGYFGAGNSGFMRVAVRFKCAQVWNAWDSGSFNFTTNVVPGDTVDFCVYGGYAAGATPCVATIKVTIPSVSTVTLDPSDGTVSTVSLTVTNSLPYGTLPTPERSGYTFGGWWTEPIGGGGHVTTATPVTATTNHTLYALWLGTVTAAAGTGGSISPAGAVTVPRGGTADFAIQPDAEYLIADVLVNGMSVGAVSSYSFIGVMSNQTIQANFTPVQRGMLRFQKASYSVAENAGVVKLTVERVGGTYGEALADVVIRGETATEDADFVCNATALRWAAGQSGTKTVLVEILDDAIYDDGETFRATLTNETGAALGVPSSTIISIADDEIAPTRVPRLSEALDFGTVATNATVWRTVWRTVEVWNDGNQALSVTNVQLPNCFSVTQQIFTVPAGGSVSLAVRFSPSSLGIYAGFLLLASDATAGTNALAVSGTGVVPVQPAAKRTITALSAVIAVDVPEDATSLGVEDSLAPGLVPVSISDGGNWDSANRKVKWFFSEAGKVRDRALQYTVNAAGSVVTGAVNFGHSDLPIAGDTVFAGTGTVGLLHPADDNGDWSITLQEVSACITRWKNGEDADTKTPVVIRGITLYLQGEQYYYSPDVSAEAKRWIPSLTLEHSTAYAPKTALAKTASLAATLPGVVRSASLTNVTVAVTPATATTAWGLEEIVSTGAQVTAVSDSGTWDSSHHTIRWAFFDGHSRTLSYTLTGQAGTNITVSGIASFDGSDEAVTGTSSIAIPLSFSVWAERHGLSGDLGAAFQSINGASGQPNGLVYAVQPNICSNESYLAIGWEKGQPYVETPKQDPATVSFVTLCVEGATNLIGADWTMPLSPATDQSSTPANRCRWTPSKTADRSFFRLKAIPK